MKNKASWFKAIWIMNTFLAVLIVFESGFGVFIQTVGVYLYILWYQYLALVKNKWLVYAIHDVTDPDGIKILHVSAVLITPLAYIMYISVN